MEHPLSVKEVGPNLLKISESAEECCCLADKWRTATAIATGPRSIGLILEGIRCNGRG
jgi:hypothetical protein